MKLLIIILVLLALIYAGSIIACFSLGIKKDKIFWIPFVNTIFYLEYRKARKVRDGR